MQEQIPLSEDVATPPAASSLLDHLEIAVESDEQELAWSINAAHYVSFTNPDYLGRPIETLEVTFRHGGWKPRRNRTIAALMRTHAKPARVGRFLNCGSSCWIERSPSTQRVRIAADLCHDRWCVPCQIARAREFQRRLINLTKDRDIRMMTLTLRHSEQRLSDTIDRLYEAFRRLRQRNIWKDHVTGAAAVLELKIGRDSLWHPHLHVLWQGTYIPHSTLSSAWLACTGDSQIVDVRQVKDAATAGRYVAKYLSKGVPNDVTHDPARFDEAMLTLKGRQLILTLGNWRKADPEEHETDAPTDWKPVASLRQFIEGLRSAEPWAVALKDALRQSYAPP